MAGGVGAGSFFLCTLRGGFRLDYTADTLILLLRKLVAQLIQHILQMLLQGFIPEMLLDGILPTPVNPQCDVYMIRHLSCPPSP